MKEKYIKAAQKSDKLLIDIGTELNIEFKELESRFKSSLLGIVPSKYVIAQIPEIISNDFVVKCNRKKGGDVVVRYLYDGSVYGFKSKYIGITPDPINLMILQYPNEIEACNIRKDERVNCILPGKLKIGEDVQDVSILDLSASGCQVAIINSDVDLERIGSELSANDRLQLLVQVPGEGKGLIMNAIHKNVRRDNLRLSVGVQFSKLMVEIRKKIDKFIVTAKEIQHR